MGLYHPESGELPREGTIMITYVRGEANRSRASLHDEEAKGALTNNSADRRLIRQSIETRP